MSPLRKSGANRPKGRATGLRAAHRRRAGAGLDVPQDNDELLRGHLLRISLAAGHSVRFFVDSGNGGTWTPGSTLLDMRNLQQLGIDSAAPSCHLGWSLGSRPARLRQSANRGHSPKLDDRLFETESGR